MTALQQQEFVVRESWPPGEPDGLAGGIARLRPAKTPSNRRNRVDDGLARRLLAYLPLAVAVINADTILSFWNEHASLLFGAPPMMAAERPTLAQMLARIANLTQPQRDRILAFAQSHIEAGDRTEPDECLRLSLDRAHRIAIEIHGLGAGRWMLVFDDGKVTAAGKHAAPVSGDAWLDPLTGLSNRRHFNDALTDALSHDTEATHQALMLIDIDGFASVNEAFGHTACDALLCLVAQRLRREIRDDDLLARLGGDEFALLIPNGDGAQTLAARVIANMAQPFLVEGKRVTIGVSIGLVCFPGQATTADDLMRHAGLALYQAKSDGGGACRMFDAVMAAQARARQELETDLRKALMLQQISLTYQACGNMPSHALTGFEAHLHWDHPTRGVVPERAFMPLAETTGLIVALSEFALKSACAEAAAWPSPLTVAVRLSPRQLQDADRLTAAVQAALADSNLVPHRLELKVPETALLGKVAEVLPTLHALRALGVGIALVECTLSPTLLNRLRSFPFRAVAINTDNLSHPAAGANNADIPGVLATAGIDHVACYFEGPLIATSEIADAVRLHAVPGNPISAMDQACQAQ
jgi:diguanylate cyclase (GGDEF)-like protein